MTLDEFVAQWNGKGIDTDGYYGFQCFDLAHKYAIDVCGKDIPGAPAAKDLWNLSPEGYEKIANTPDGVPQKGDIIIWGTGVGAFGHVAVFVSGDTNSFTSFDQNWPVGTLCHLQQHNYTGVLGWFRKPAQETVQLDKATFEKLVANSTKWDQVQTMGYSSTDDIAKAIQKLTDERNAAQYEEEQVATKLAECMESHAQDTTGALVKSQIKPLVFSGWLTYLRSRSAIQKIVNV